MFGFKKVARTAPAPTRIIKSTRWVHTNELKIGMHVNELDCPWEKSPFMLQGFVIDNLTLLQEVQSVCEYVCIRSEKLAHIPTSSPRRLCSLG